MSSLFHHVMHTVTKPVLLNKLQVITVWYTSFVYTGRQHETMPPIFFSQNVIAVTTKFTWMNLIHFAIMRPFFHKVFVIFDTLLPKLSTMLYAKVVKFPVLISEHVRLLQGNVKQTVTVQLQSLS
jgi:hypothetical protein